MHSDSALNLPGSPCVRERPCEPADLPAIIEIYNASIRTLAAAYYSREQIAAWAPKAVDTSRWAKRLAGLQTVVAESDGVLAGFASYNEDGYLDFLFTHPAFARRGIATRLYLWVESVLRQRSVPLITTHASLAAKPFFEHCGFEVDGEESVECRGVQLTRFAMHKQL